MQRLNNFLESEHSTCWVVGGAGFLGSHICDLLISLGGRIVCIDNWRFGINNNIRHLLDNPNFRLEECDITKPLPNSIARPHYIFHSGITDGNSSAQIWVDTFSTQQLLHIATKAHAKFLLISNKSVSGDTFPKNKLTDYFADPLLFSLEGKRLAEILTAEYVKRNRLNARVVRVTDLYGPRMLISGDPLGEIFKAAIYKTELKDIDERFVWPLFVEDAAQGAISAMFGAGTKDRIFSFRVPSISLKEFAQLVRGVQRSYLPQQDVASIIQPLDDYTLPAQTSLQNGISKTLNYLEAYKIQLPLQPRPTRLKGLFVSRKLPLFSKLKAIYKQLEFLHIKAFILPTIFIFLLLLPLFNLSIATLIGEVGKKQFLLGNFNSAGRLFSIAQGMYSLNFSLFGNFSQFPILGETLGEFSNSAYSGVLATRVAQRSSRIGVIGSNIATSTFGQEGGQDQTFSLLGPELEALSVELGFLIAQTKDQKSTVQFLNNIPPNFSDNLFHLSSFSRQLPTLLGFDRPKKYLVLFQNNMELRPTGGFIGSFGLFTFERGKLVDSQIQDVYQADGQLRGHVEPPPKLREHLGEANWYLRDSNWSPDFPTTAARTEWFLEKELERQVDGVIAVDLEFVKSLIAVLEKVEVNDFGEVITAENFYPKTQARAQSGFFPGSTQKADFLTALYRSLVGELISKSSNLSVPLTKAVLSSFKERNISIFLHDQNANDATVALGWDGGIRNVKCRAAGIASGDARQMSNVKCTEDYLFVVEANVGVNKANYRLSRKYFLDLFLSPDRILHELAIVYKNGQDPYKNYLRLYLPQESVFLKAELVNIGTGDKTILTFDPSTEGGKSVFGMLVEIPPGEGRELRLSWQIPMTGAKSGELGFLWQKQAGTDQDPVNLRFYYPEGVDFVFNPAPGLTGATTVGYTTSLSSDIEIFLGWIDKN